MFGSATPRLIAALVIAALFIAGCGDDAANESASAANGTTSGIEVAPSGRSDTAQTPPGAGEVKLWVSNQSFDDPTINMAIQIDGETVVADDFPVEDQHHTIGYLLSGLESGEHVMTITTDTGAETTETFTVEADEPRWLVANYWYAADGGEVRHVTFEESDRQVGFD